MLDIDLIIPCYGPAELINRGLASIATQWKREYIHVTLVNDCSPHTDDNYQELIDRYKDSIDIRCIKTPHNGGQGLARQYGIDHTDHDWIFFMDEDDQLGSGIAASCFCNPIESNGLVRTPDGSIRMKNGEPVRDPNVPDIGVVIGPLFEFDDYHTHVIPSSNTVWPTAKLYSREFIYKHKIKFNEEQSRHAEDYFFTSCFFYALDHDPDYVGIQLDDKGMYYIWYPNPNSQSRKDPHYGYMLAGYTMGGSVNILKYMLNTRKNGIKMNKEIKKEISARILNMTIYCYYNYLSWLVHFFNTDYKPDEKDWTMLRDSTVELMKMCKSRWDEYTYNQKYKELWNVHEHSDVTWTDLADFDPVFEFDNFINAVGNSSAMDKLYLQSTLKQLQLLRKAKKNSKEFVFHKAITNK